MFLIDLFQYRRVNKYLLEKNKRIIGILSVISDKSK